MCGDPIPDPFSVSMSVRGRNVNGGREIIIKLDPETYDKARRVAYARGFPNVDRLIESYIQEWIEYDLNYVED